MTERAYNAKRERNRAIHTLWQSGEWTQTQIAALFEITQPRVRGILFGRDWAEFWREGARYECVRR